MKKCNCCNIEKDLSEFFKQNKKKSGYYSQCKSCTYAVQKKRRDYMLELVKRYKMKKGCEECGYKGHFAALHLDHLDPSKKYLAVSSMQTHTISKVKNEIRKCRVLCANCHAVHTHFQMLNRLKSSV